jgi:hypothetical protein
MRLRCSEKSDVFDGWDPESLEVPKRLSEGIEPPLLVPVDFLPAGTEGRVLFVGCLSVRLRSRAARGASLPPSLAGRG